MSAVDSFDLVSDCVARHGCTDTAVTPGFRDIIFHTQFCCMLGMLAVKWPPLVCKLTKDERTVADIPDPILSQGSWSTLVWSTCLYFDFDKLTFQT